MTAGWRARWNCPTPAGCGAIASAPMARSRRRQLDELKKGVEVDGVKYGSIDATLERDQGANVWLVFAIREGKNREVRNVMAHLGLEVNRLIRVSYGPFQLGELAEGAGRGGQDPGAARAARRKDRRAGGRGFQPADAGRSPGADATTTATRRAARSRSSRPARAA